MIATIIRLVSIPVMLLNLGGGIVGGIWLVVLGKWGLLGIGLASVFISSIGLGLALTPSMLFSMPGAVALERGKYVLGILCLMAGNLWTYAVMTVWCVGCFYFVIENYYTGGSLWPYLLWAYGMATGPWTYMATREGGPAETVSGSTIAAFGACVGAIAIMGIILFKDQPSILDATIAFCVPILAVFVFQIFASFHAVRAEARCNGSEPVA